MESASRRLFFLLLIGCAIAFPLVVTVSRERAPERVKNMGEAERCRHLSAWWFLGADENGICSESSSQTLSDSRWEGLSTSRSWLWNNERVSEYENAVTTRLSSLPVREVTKEQWMRFRGDPIIAFSFLGWVLSFFVYLRGKAHGKGIARRRAGIIGCLFLAIWALSLAVRPL